MYNKEITEFFKRHNLYDEEMFEYLSSHTIYMDYYNNPEARCTIGAAPKRIINNKIQDIGICMPYPVDYETTMICIHEIVHGIEIYKHLNKKPIDPFRSEALPFLYERIYQQEINDKNYFGEFLDDINESLDNKYTFALYAREILLEKYNKNFNKMEKLSKKLVRKYKKENKL